MPYACPLSGSSGPLKQKTSAVGLQDRLPPTQATILIPLDDDDNIALSQQLPTNAGNSNANHGSSLFDLYNDEDEDPEDQKEPTSVKDSLLKSKIPTPINTNQPLRQQIHRSNVASNRSSHNTGGLSKLSLSLSDLLRFPKESTHAYSYAHLSPNSLAVRLSILKRSLEILLDRPDLMNGKGNDFDFSQSAGVNLDIENFINQLTSEGTPEENEKRINVRSNASSAALSALFTSNSSSTPTKSTSDKDDKQTSIGLKTLIKILSEDELKGSSSTTKKELAKNLHDLSLTSYKDEENDADSESQLKVKLLYALATPFYESIAQTPIISLNKGASTLALSSLNIPTSPKPRSPGPTSNKFFHSSQRNTSPQAVFTCELSDPWNLKAANDLSCLVFGISQNSLRRLTLLDLISPDSRDFVFNKLIENSFTKNEIIFSGEIIAIAKSANKLTWASLWAKKKGNLIICMFDQVPCDSVDIVVNFDTFDIESSKKISGGNFFNNISQTKNLCGVINNFDVSMAQSREENENSNIPRTILDSQAINEQRYFTIKKSGFNIPCAITSKVIDENQSKAKLKIHTMPYIAGVFIISFADHKLMSFNESISKNLFGFNEKQLINQPITKIIPNFDEIMNFIAVNLKNLKLIPGLVLPEHFFRQMDCLIQDKSSDSFLDSIGLDGVHSDGSIIKIDIQLRCSQKDTLVLWITHSRTVYGESLNKKGKVSFKVDDESQGSEKADSKPRSFTNLEGEFSQHGDLPNQMSLFNENEIPSISRSPSVRSKHASSSSVSSATSFSTGSLSITSSKQSSSCDLKNLVSPLTSIEKKSGDVNVESYKVLDSNMDEGKLLEIENDTIQRHRSISKHYPKVIGEKRRVKSFKEFKVLKGMGKGAYGKVVLAENKNDPNYRVVIKMIIKERILVDTWVRDRKLGTIPSEIQIMATLNNNPHPNIMRLIDFFEDDDYYYIEIPQHGFPIPAIDLFDMIELRDTMTEAECKSIIKQAASALNHLHKNGVVHRDIKDENLIIDSNGVIKLIDFGSAAYIKQGPFDVFVGTLDYAAPEVLNGQPYEGKPQDVWSLGILIYTLIYKENPFYNVDEIMEGELRIPFVMSAGSLNLIEKILQRDIRKRPTMEDVVIDEWLCEP